MNATDLISDPLFRMGYDDSWSGRDADVQRHWDTGERSIYHLGYDFACDLQDMGEPRIPLSRGGLPNSEAVALLATFRAISSAGAA